METSTNYSKTAGVRRADKSENTTLFRNVYLWMTMALFITGATALTVSDSPTLLNAIFGSKVAFFGLIIAELALVIILSSFIFRMSFLTATLMFIAYSILNGATLASIFLLYTASSIASTFFVTAGTFGAMALFGYFTKRDLSGIGNMGYMALIGIIIATVVNLFLRSETMMWVITYIGVLVFVALTAYDTQKIKKMVMNAEVVDESTQKIALLGSLTLYLDFINLFLYLLRILGSRTLARPVPLLSTRSRAKTAPGVRFRCLRQPRSKASARTRTTWPPGWPGSGARRRCRSWPLR